MSSVRDQMANHMEFLGYTIERPNENLIVGRHDKFFNTIIREYSYGLIFTFMFGLNQKGKRSTKDVNAKINKLNERANICRYYVDKDGDLFIEAWHPNVYDKTLFGQFLESLNANSKYIIDGETSLMEYID